MQVVNTEDAPAPVGAYSQGIVDDGRLYVSGQVGLDPETGEVVSDDIAEQTERTMRNLEAIVEAAGATMDDVVKVQVYLTDIEEFEAFNEVYGNYLDEPYPARAAVEVADLFSTFQVEIDLVASLD